MTQKNSSYIEAAYGWDYGESGWNSGMDNNILKFSFLFDSNIDGVVASLPAAANGKSYFLTTDNRFYFAVENTYYSCPCPNYFIFKEKVSGQHYQFIDGSHQTIDNPSEVSSKLSNIELTVSFLGSAAFMDESEFVTSASLDIAKGQAGAYTDALRNDLLNTSSGASNVGYSGGTVESALNYRAYVTPDMYGAVTGPTDQSAAIHAALASGKRVIIDKEYYVNARPGLVIPSNSHITFIKGKGRIRALSLNQNSYNILNLHEVSNVLIEYPEVIGDRASNTSSGEWGHGITISASENVTLVSPVVKDCFGDGMYIGRTIVDATGAFVQSSTMFCKNIWIKSPLCQNNRRNNISVITVDGLWIDDPVLLNANGIAPEAGIDLEPNNAAERMSNVFISNLRTSDNLGAGLALGLRNMSSVTYPIGIHVTSMHSTGDKDILMAVPGDLSGVVKFGNIVIENSKKNGLNLEKLDVSTSMQFTMEDVTIKNCNTTNEASASLGSAVSYWRNTSLVTYPLGGAVIGKLHIDSPLSTNGIYFNDASASAPNERKLIIGDITMINNSASFAKLLLGGPLTWNDSRDVSIKTLTSAESSIYAFSYSDYKSKVYGHDTKDTVVNLPALSGNGVIGSAPVTLFATTGAFFSRFTPNAADKIMIGGKAAGASIQATELGASITLKPTQLGWEVISRIGTWS